MTVSIMISNGKEAYLPAVKEGIQLDLERKGSPGTLKFAYFDDGHIKTEEGNQVKLTVDGPDLFFGFISGSISENLRIQVIRYHAEKSRTKPSLTLSKML